MNINYYQIEFAKDNDIELKNYMSLFRHYLYYSEQNLAPQKITFQPELLQILEGELFAHRLGLIMFKRKDDSLEPCTHRFEIVNQSDEVKSIYSKDLCTEEIEPINKTELVLRVPPKFKSAITIEFEKGKGTDHARYSRIEGYRMDTKDNCKIRFELNNQTIDKTIERFKSILNSSEDNL